MSDFPQYDFIQQDKTVSVELTADEQRLILAIHDNGIGVCQDPDRLHLLYRIIFNLTSEIRQ